MAAAGVAACPGVEPPPGADADAAPGACQALVAALLVALVLATLVHACKVCLREGWSGAPGGQSAAEGPAPRRRCSLVELTVSRHARRESALRHASSFDHAGGPRPTGAQGPRPVPLLRRSSFPAHQSARPETPASRRTSVDASEGDSSPDTARRRVRIIRRH